MTISCDWVTGSFFSSSLLSSEEEKFGETQWKPREAYGAIWPKTNNGTTLRAQGKREFALACAHEREVMLACALGRESLHLHARMKEKFFLHVRMKEKLCLHVSMKESLHLHARMNDVGEVVLACEHEREFTLACEHERKFMLACAHEEDVMLACVREGEVMHASKLGGKNYLRPVISTSKTFPIMNSTSVEKKKYYAIGVYEKCMKAYGSLKHFSASEIVRVKKHKKCYLNKTSTLSSDQTQVRR